jgi:hypothetical protein
MAFFRPRFGAPIESGARTLIPVSEHLSLRTPFGGIVWNRPRGILVREGETRRLLPIPDTTRRIQWTFFAVGAAVALAVRLARARTKPR